VSELLMTLDGENEEMVLDITGNIDMSTVAELGQAMNMHGMNNLSKMRNHHDDDDDD